MLLPLLPRLFCCTAAHLLLGNVGNLLSFRLLLLGNVGNLLNLPSGAKRPKPPNKSCEFTGLKSSRSEGEVRHILQAVGGVFRAGVVERFGAVGDSLAGLLRMVVGDAARARDEDDSRSRRSGRSFGPRGCCWPRQIGGAGDSEDWDWDDGASGGAGSDERYGCVLARLDSVGRARLRSAAGQCAGRWLEAMPTHHRLRASAQHFSLKVVRSSTLHDVMDAGAPCPRTVDRARRCVVAGHRSA